MNECETLTGRKKLICRGEAGLPLNGSNSTNDYRASWGFAPLAELPTDALGEATVEAPPKAAGPPPLLIRGSNFGTALARWTLAGMPRRTQSEIETRLAICQSCEFLKHQHCTQCGCLCDDHNRLLNKLALATERCPLGKWP